MSWFRLYRFLSSANLFKEDLNFNVQTLNLCKLALIEFIGSFLVFCRQTKGLVTVLSCLSVRHGISFRDLGAEI